MTYEDFVLGRDPGMPRTIHRIDLWSAIDKDAVMHNEYEPSQQTEEVIVANPHIWKRSGLSRPEFLKRVRGFRKIRVRSLECPQEMTELPVFSYFPRGLQSWGLLERLHSLVNEGDFSVFDERIDDFIVALIIAPQLARWLLNTRIATIQGQILNWLAAWLTFHADLPDKRITSLPPGIHEKVEAIRRSHYGRGF